MKTFLIVIFISVSYSCFGQFHDSLLLKLSKLNCELTEAWNFSLRKEKLRVTASNDTLSLPSIYIILDSYLTEGDSGNEGVGIYINEKKYSQKIRSKSWNRNREHHVFIDTKSYIVEISYSIVWNDVYVTMLKTLIPELEAFFRRHSDTL
jgi:hypothetical protein